MARTLLLLLGLPLLLGGAAASSQGPGQTPRLLLVGLFALSRSEFGQFHAPRLERILTPFEQGDRPIGLEPEIGPARNFCPQV